MSPAVQAQRVRPVRVAPDPLVRRTADEHAVRVDEVAGAPGAARDPLMHVERPATRDACERVDGARLADPISLADALYELLATLPLGAVARGLGGDALGGTLEG